MKAHLPGKKRICPGPGGVVKELAPGAASDSHRLNESIGRADDLHVTATKLMLRPLSELGKLCGRRQFSNPSFPSRTRLRLQGIHVKGRLLVGMGPVHGGKD